MEKWEDKLDKIFEDNMIGYCSQIGGAEEIQIKELIEQELDKARKEGKIEVLTEIFQTCYQEDSKTLELVEEKLSKLKDNK